MGQKGPSLAYGLFLVAVLVLAAVLLEDQPWKTIAVVNVGVHLVSGLAWTMTPTSRTALVREAGVSLWLLTVIAGQLLLLLAIILLIF